MQRDSQLIRLTALAILVVSLTACGGGKSSESSHSEHESGSDESTKYSTVDDSSHSSSSTNSSSTSTSTSTSTTPTAAQIASGKTLWNNTCAACHGSAKAGARSASNILSAIASNKGSVMGSLSSTIQASQANDIAAYMSFGL